MGEIVIEYLQRWMAGLAEWFGTARTEVVATGVDAFWELAWRVAVGSVILAVLLVALILATLALARKRV